MAWRASLYDAPQLMDNACQADASSRHVTTLPGRLLTY